MNPLDLAVIGIVALSAIFAFARGFVREALSIVAWVGAAAITLYGFNWVYGQIEPRIHDRLLSQVAAGFGLFVISLILLTILTGLVLRTVRASGLSPIDRTLGFIFGLARGAFLVCLAYLLLVVSVQPSDWPVWIREAKSEPYLHEGADVLRSFLPESLKIKSAEAADGAAKALSPALEAERAMRALENPAPAAAPKPESAQPPGYRQGDQRGLDRLIGTQR
jgi:membrane protein required for colicin V production